MLVCNANIRHQLWITLQLKFGKRLLNIMPQLSPWPTISTTSFILLGWNFYDQNNHVQVCNIDISHQMWITYQLKPTQNHPYKAIYYPWYNTICNLNIFCHVGSRCTPNNHAFMCNLNISNYMWTNLQLKTVKLCNPNMSHLLCIIL